MKLSQESWPQTQDFLNIKQRW